MVFDAVVIGAGPSGLATALRLSHFGVKVCVLEAHRRLGGYNSWHCVRGHEISTGLHALTNYSAAGKGGPLGKLFRQLRLKIADLRLRPQGRSSIRFPSATLGFDNAPESIRQEIASVFPGEIDGFDRFRTLIRDTDEGEFTSRQRSAREVMESFIRDPLLVDMLFCPVMFYGNPGGVGDGKDADRKRPDMDWLLFCVMWKCIFESGLAYPAGGVRPLWERMAERIAGGGGVLRLAAPVGALVTREGRAVAARLDTGEEVEGRMFFSSAGAPETDTLLGLKPGRAGPVGEISIVEGICLLDCAAPGAGMEETIIFYSFEDRLRFARPAGLVDASSGVVCAPGNFLPADPGENILKISQLASHPEWSRLNPETYRFAKDEAAAGMAVALGKLGISPVKAQENPGRFGIFDDLFTPMTLERYTGHAGGALYGSPVKARTGETASGNVFLIGADQGFHGIVGAMLSGVAMANMHLLTKMA